MAKDRRRLQCLLSYIAEKCLLASDLIEPDLVEPLYLARVHIRNQGSPIFDTTLRFTLSALWNLTDECPDACLGFVQECGLRIYEKMLEHRTAFGRLP
ncbi:unnamed protein product [Protopolystoma xenopodis]|uniref:Protein zer-1 homolog-like C-terminal domain-containing protein n=1 Tax=Protopolystoma xenopodis TaxID=117903 RepID=A0A3S5AY79_9PLAT|nr:unnamed protein product [Protopolystoma xenopodis]